MGNLRLTSGLCVSLGVLAISCAPANAGDTFVTIQGDQFVLGGRVYKLKGTNYYPHDHMWADMWSSWDWNEIVAETAMIRNLGLNCVRILVPYSNGGWGGANPPATRLQQLEDLVNVMGEAGVRSVVTLFDWETSFPAAGTSREADHIAHLSAIVLRLKDNPYVLLWDVKNEPDHPANYGSCDCNPGACGNWDCNPAQRDKIVSWLRRMCNAVRSRDANHPVAAGMRWWENLPDVLSFVDVAIFHSYWPNIGTEEIPQTKAYMEGNPKPILVEEWGWPTHPTPCRRDGQLIWDYTEAKQLDLYVTHLTALEQHDVAGGLQWMTFDAEAYNSDADESFEQYFGLWRDDLTLKPAGEYYRDNYPVSPFPTPPPGPVTSFTAVSLGNRVQLTWTNPTDSDVLGTVVRYSNAGFPPGPQDGSPVCDMPASPGSPGSCEHAGLPPSQTYYYSAFAYDTCHVYSVPVTAMAASGVPGDFDLDMDVDLADFGHLQACFSGNYVPQSDPACLDARLDEDEDVDQTDLMIFLRCLGGPGQPARPECLGGQ